MRHHLPQLLCIAALTATVVSAEGDGSIPLAGTWRFSLDPSATGERERFFERDLQGSITLPGTTDLAGISDPKGGHLSVESIHPQMLDAAQATSATAHLTRRHPYVGVAWYQRDIDIPAGWVGRRVVLTLERSKITNVWLDAQPLGQQRSLVAPHRYQLPLSITTGHHRLTLRVDNRLDALPARGHQVAEDTQTNWNGVLGEVSLAATGTVWIDHLAIHPEVATRSALVRVRIGNLSGSPASGVLRLTCTVPGSSRPAQRQELSWSGRRDGQEVEVRIPLGTDAPLWDDLHPVLHHLRAELGVAGQPDDEVGMRFGLRELTTRGTQFVLNDRAVLLRGKHDACVFPLTGATPMDHRAWAAYFATCRSYGVNHVRFHTWCPPAAAFAAADEAGVLLQPELANFGGTNLTNDAGWRGFTEDEARRLLREYGNSPSFAFLALGNEVGGDVGCRGALVRDLRAQDGRHLYCQASNPEFWACQRKPDDDFWVTFRSRPGITGNLRGSYAHADLPLGHVQAGPADTLHDYAEALVGTTCPLVSHEVGQYQVFPDFAEIERYTGVLRPLNLEIFRDRLRHAGMLDQAADFLRASGALAVINYREEIEAALRTNGLGGFQLLDLQDFPGQGTALVGILNAFMESKGLIDPATWREFCADQVVLAKFPRYTWRAGETFTAAVALANYGAQEVRGDLTYDLADASGNHLAGGVLPLLAPQGRTSDAQGRIACVLPALSSAQRLTLTVGLAGTGISNHYPLWLYPAVDATAPEGVSVVRRFDAAAAAGLARGERVLLVLAGDAMPRQRVDGFFSSDFWCYPMFKRITDSQKLPAAPGTLGLLIQERHPALAGFPTSFHSDYQWSGLVQHGSAAILDRWSGFKPIVQVIDNTERNHRLGMIFEAQVGPGRLLVCAADLLALGDHPEAVALLASLQRYAASQAFTPSAVIDPALVAETLAP